jgi:hypothetical protein
MFCFQFLRVSPSIFTIAAFADNVCRFHQHSGRPDSSIDYWIICTIYELLCFGAEPGLRAIRDSISPGIQDLLQNLRGTDVEWESWMITDVTSKISEILDRTSQ